MGDTAWFASEIEGSGKSASLGLGLFASQRPAPDPLWPCGERWSVLEPVTSLDGLREMLWASMSAVDVAALAIL